MAEVTRVAPADWFEGRVNDDLTMVVAEDGTEYRLPFREQRGLKDGERVKFTLSSKIYRGKQWVKRVMLLP